VRSLQLLLTVPHEPLIPAVAKAETNLPIRIGNPSMVPLEHGTPEARTVRPRLGMTGGSAARETHTRQQQQGGHT
jgi:hypothetical protein